MKGESSDGHRPPLQADRGAEALDDLIRYFVPAVGAAGEDIVFAPPRKQGWVSRSPLVNLRLS